MHSFVICPILVIAIHATLIFSQHLGITVLKHQPCRQKAESGWVEKIRFPTERTAPLLQDPSRPGCYSMSGSVEVAEDIRGEIQLYVTMKHSLDGSEQTCHNPDPISGCGGWGSCLYCSACNAEQVAHKITTEARLTVNGRNVDCREGLRKGTHNNVQLSFCLPTKEEFLRAQGLTEAQWNDIMNGNNQQQQSRISVFLTIRIINASANQLMIEERRREDIYRRARRRQESDPIPDNIKRTFPFTKSVIIDNNFIGCHKVFGNLFINTF